MVKFTPREVRPEAGNKYYITKTNGGYSLAIKGKCKATGKPDSACDTLSNCVGFAAGRFNEEGGYGYMKYPLVVNAENCYAKAKELGLEVGLEPRVGGMMVWKKGATLSDVDGAGHVEIVEYKYSPTKVRTSSSGYNSSVFWMTTREKGDGNWRIGCSWMGVAYIYLGCIYNPDITDTITTEPLLKGSKGDAVSQLQKQLNQAGNYGLVVDGSFGPTTERAVRDFQAKHSLTVDGVVGPSTMAALDDAITAVTKPTGVFDLSLVINGVAATTWATTIAGQNYIRVADLDNLGLVRSVTWNPTKKITEIRK